MNTHTHTHTHTYIPAKNIKPSVAVKTPGGLSRTLLCFSFKRIDHPLFTTSYLLKPGLSTRNKPFATLKSGYCSKSSLIMKRSLSFSISVSLASLFFSLSSQDHSRNLSWRSGGKGVNLRGSEPGLS